MDVKGQIDFMIAALKVAKDEIEYAERYKKLYEADKKKGVDNTWSAKTYSMRNPNGTLIRENLKTVARMGNIVAHKIKLSPYCSDVERGE